MTRVNLEPFLEKVYGCKTCRTPLAKHVDKFTYVSANAVSFRPAKTDFVQPAFRGLKGEAFLFHNVENVEPGQPEERAMTTGPHIIRDISCKKCKEVVGWTYDKAPDQEQKYKEGKFILEAESLCDWKEA
jgi:hypothetical protein